MTKRHSGSDSDSSQYPSFLVRKSIGRNLKMQALQQALHLPELPTAVGMWVLFLAWVAENRPDGVVIRPAEKPRLVVQAVEEACGWKRRTGKNRRTRGQLFGALKGLGLVVAGPDASWTVNDWPEINAPTFARAKDAQRKKEERQKVAQSSVFQKQPKPMESLANLDFSEAGDAVGDAVGDTQVTRAKPTSPDNHSGFQNCVHGRLHYPLSGVADGRTDVPFEPSQPGDFSTTTGGAKPRTARACGKQGLAPLVVVVKSKNFQLGEIPGDWTQSLGLELNDPGDALVWFLGRHRKLRPEVPPHQRDRVVPKDWEDWHFNLTRKHGPEAFEYLVDSYLRDKAFANRHWRAVTMMHENVCDARLAQYHVDLQDGRARQPSDFF